MSLSEIKSLDKDSAIALYNQLNLPIPKGADLDFLRSSLRLIKINQKPLETTHLYQNAGEILKDQVPEYQNTSEEHDYEDIDDFSSNSNCSASSETMPAQGDRIPAITIPCFSGKRGECVVSFLKTYEKAAQINRWTEEEKQTYVSLYLSGTAADRLELFENQNPAATWQALKETLLKEYSPRESKTLMIAQLNARVQLPTEPVGEYVTDVEKLCARVDTNMSQDAVCSHIIKGLSPMILNQIGVLDNSTLAKLKENLGRSDLSSILLRQRLGLETGSTSQGTHNLEAQIKGLSEMVQQLQVETRKAEDRGRVREGRDYDSRYERDYGEARREDFRPRYEDYRPRWEDFRPRRDDSRQRRDNSRPREEDYRRRRDGSRTRRYDSRIREDSRTRRYDSRIRDDSRTRRHGSRIREDSRPRQNFREQDHSYRSRSRSQSWGRGRQEGNRSVRFEDQNEKEVRCWDCDGVGHFYKNCPKN